MKVNDPVFAFRPDISGADGISADRLQKPSRLPDWGLHARVALSLRDERWRSPMLV